MKVFCDFDGTITVKDVNAQFFNTFMIKDNKDILNDWRNGKINAKECLTVECSLVRAQKKEIDKLLDNQIIEPSFFNFLTELDENKIELIIISDGFDFYIQKILKKYNLENIRYYSNKMIFYDNDRVKPEFPYYSPECENCANCKGLHIKKLKSDNEISVFVGDGYADRCAIPYTDVIFAKGEFYDYCLKNNIESNYFKNFNDILMVLKENYPSYFQN